jgi:hypothetical protein
MQDFLVTYRIPGQKQPEFMQVKAEDEQDAYFRASIAWLQMNTYGDSPIVKQLIEGEKKVEILDIIRTDEIPEA